MRVLAAVAFVAALTSTALAQPGMTQPTYGPPPPPPGAPAPAPAPQGQPYYGGGYGYQPHYMQPQPPVELRLKSSGTALLWAVGTTVAGIAAIGAAFEEESGGLLLIGGGLTLIGPSAGHIYAGERGHALKGSLLRAGGLLVFALGAVAHEERYDNCGYYDDACYYEENSDGEVAMWIGGLVVVGSALYDFYDAGRAVTRYNDRRRKAASYQFSPTMMSTRGGGVTPGVGVTGSF